jgi:CAS/CSE protein involved in chromosome segregation
MFICSQDTLEFLPYTFQILSLLLEFRPRGSISAPYLELYPFLLSPVLWSRPGNIHPLVRLLRAFITKSEPSQFSATLKLNNVLGVFQKLIASKVRTVAQQLRYCYATVVLLLCNSCAIVAKQKVFFKKKKKKVRHPHLLRNSFTIVAKQE